MQIVIPMSGFGERFRRAGYTVPKPLVRIEGKTIIEHVVDMFPGDNYFIFICNKDHLASTDMNDVLHSICAGKKYKIVPIDSHKLGPVYAVSKAFEFINVEEPIIVNYCDFTCYWNFNDFKQWTQENNCDGALPSYKGFHPHSLGNTNYAYIRENNFVFEAIKEKEPFTDDRMNEFASSGTYYFARGSYVIKYFRALMDKNINLNGEFYCSLVYNLMYEDGLRSQVYELEHFMQWGTPEDVQEYNHWSSIFHRLHKYNIQSFSESYPSRSSNPLTGTNVMTMAGLGSRFTKEGYLLPKPLLPVNQSLMFVEAFCSLPPAEQSSFVIRSKYESDIAKALDNLNLGSVSLNSIDEPTSGQSLTAKLALSSCIPDKPVTITSCDHAVLFDHEKFKNLTDQKCDVIVWGFKNYYSAVRNPKMYGWVGVNDDSSIIRVNVKDLPSNLTQDYVITGTFTFKSPEILSKLIDLQVANQNKINGEYYIDSAIEEAIKLGLNCKVFEVSNYICWGTPNELKTYEYWQSCFSKWSSHDYKLISN